MNVIASSVIHGVDRIEDSNADYRIPIIVRNEWKIIETVQFQLVHIACGRENG